LIKTLWVAMGSEREVVMACDFSGEFDEIRTLFMK